MFTVGMALQAGGIFCSAAASLLLARTDFLVDDLFFCCFIFSFVCCFVCFFSLSLLFDSPLVFDSPDNAVECLVFLKVGVALLMMDAEVYIFPLRARSSFLLY